MENIEVHSKDFVLRWVHVSPGCKVSWKVVPTKRSINFGVYARGGTDMDSKTILQTMSQTVGTIKQRLEAAGCVPLAYNGIVRIEAKDALEGAAQVDQGHMIAFVFDNTFSKSYSKNVELAFNVEEPVRPHNVPRGNDAAAAASAALYSRDGHSTSRPQLDENTGLPTRRAQESPALAQQQQFPSIESQPSQPAVTGHRDRAGSTHSSADTVESESTRASAPAPLRQRQSTLSSSGGSDNELTHSLDGRYVTGPLQKKRRKQFQGFARRYFSLDKKMGLLNYYLNARSRSLRGVMPMRIADLSADPKTLQLTLDSGMEKWTLKAGDAASFEAWQREFEAVRSTGIQETDSETESEPVVFYDQGAFSAPGGGAVAEDSPSQGFAPRDAGDSTLSASQALGPDSSALKDLGAYIKTLPTGLQQNQLESIYERLAAGGAPASSSPGDRTPRPAATTHPSSATITTFKRSQQESGNNNTQSLQELALRSKPGYVTGAIVGMLLGSLLGSFVVLVTIVALSTSLGGALYIIVNPELLAPAEEKRPRSEMGPEPESHAKSTDAFSSSESHHRSLSEDEDDLSGDSDAEDDLPTSKKSVSYVPQKPKHIAKPDSASGRNVQIDQPDVEYETEDPEVAAVFRQMAEKNRLSREEYTNAEVSKTDASKTDASKTEPSKVTEGTQGAPEAQSQAPSTTTESAAAAALSKTETSESTAETSLYPLPHDRVKRRTNVKGPTQPPPSLLSMLKKARDPSTMVAPVTANEPLSGLQSTAEVFENSSMLDAASHARPGSHLRVMLVAVFAVARLASMRSKERALRKPFTPLLGETYEMVREDRGLRFVAEKVMHKPEVVATQTESPHWTAHFTSRPHTKMWAKTVQITDVGHFNVTFPDGESVSYINPELFIRNILAGERYIDPSGTFTVESSAGSRYTATVEFKSKGMFGGRSEEVKLTCGELVYEGKWTEAIYNKGKVVWSAKPLVSDPQSHYGWPVFAAQLNEITPIENDALPPNDSRLRPDLRFYENQDIDKAEETKLRIEQHQRERRKELETTGKQHEPFFFVKSNDEKGYYMLQQGEKNYWVRREAQKWSEIPKWFQ